MQKSNTSQFVASRAYKPRGKVPSPFTTYARLIIDLSAAVLIILSVANHFLHYF